MNNSLKKISLNKSLMLTILLWISMSIPISYFGIEIHTNIIFAFIITLGVLILTIIPISYAYLLYRHKCPKCNALWCFSYSGEKVVDSAIQEKEGVKVKISRVLSTHSCDKCGHTKTKIKVIKENL
jgi:hypothetical protein